MRPDRRYASRNRTGLQQETTSVDAPSEAPARTLAPREVRALHGQPRRVPALTTSRTFGSKSPLVTAHLHAFLAKCMSQKQWEEYSEKEKLDILLSLPPTRREKFVIKESELEVNGQTMMYDLTSGPPLRSEFCSKDPYLKRAIARFKRDLADGYYEKTWQEKAKKAHQERLEGRFDEFLAQHTEDMFLEDEHEEEEDRDELAEESEDGEYLEGHRKNERPRKAPKEG